MTTTADLFAAFVVGLFGSLHCIGMCGPLAALGCRAGKIGSSFYSSLLFVTGKLGGYGALGILAGLIGAAVVNTISFNRMAGIVSLVGGCLMLLILLLSHRPRIGSRASRVAVSISRASLKSGRVAPLLLGVAAALLPCGLLYAMVARSAAVARPVMSMSLMLAFGLGTTPALLGVGTVLRALPQKWARFGTVAGEMVIALTAAVLIWRGMAGLLAPPAGPSCCN